MVKQARVAIEKYIKDNSETETIEIQLNPEFYNVIEDQIDSNLEKFHFESNLKDKVEIWFGFKPKFTLRKSKANVYIELKVYRNLFDVNEVKAYLQEIL